MFKLLEMLWISFIKDCYNPSNIWILQIKQEKKKI